MQTDSNDFERGVMAPADGNAGKPPAVQPADDFSREESPSSRPHTRSDGDAGAVTPESFGANFERLEDERPDLVNALRELVRQYRMEGVAARRHEIRRIRQARLFWQGMQYNWWNESDMNWHLPYEHRAGNDQSLEDMPRYQFVTNFYQGFGLSFVAVLSQDVPSELTDPQLAQTNALNQQLLGQQQSLGSQLAAQYQNIFNNPGYSPATQAAITGQSQGALASAFDSLQQAANNRVARTGNAAGFADLTDELARQKAEQQSNLAQKNQVTFANTAALQQQNAALQGLSGLYGIDTNLLGRTLGIPAQLLNVRANSSRPSGFFTSMGSSLGGTLGALPSLFM
jgi:hypothetical protein